LFYSMDFLLVLVLATWRISSLFVNEDGPFGMFAKWRNLFGVRYDEQSQPYGTSVLGELFSCIFCFSIWVGLILMIAYSYYPNQTILACLPFALSAGAIMVNKWTQ